MDVRRLEHVGSADKEFERSEFLLLKLFGAITFAILTSAASQIRIPLPFTPIPMTLQTFIVPLAGGFLGAYWGGASMLIFVLIGITNLIGFAAAPGGLEMFFAPSTGYILGFFLAAMIVGFAQDRKIGNAMLLAVLVLANILIFTGGIAGLMINSGMNFQEAWLKGVAPFISGGIIKLAASFLILVGWNHFRSRKCAV